MKEEIGEPRTTALLADVSLGDDQWGRVERLIRRLANRHGCPAGRLESCPDPQAHARDVAAMAAALGAAGFVPYTPGLPPKQKPRKTTTREAPRD